MIQAYLDSIKEAAAEIAIQYTNGRINAVFTGNGEYNETFNNSMRLHYLLGAIDSVYLVGGVPHIGSTAVTDAYVKELSNKIWHYNGIYRSVELDDYAVITPDNGDGGSIRQYFNNDDVYNSFINALGGEKKATSLGIRFGSDGNGYRYAELPKDYHKSIYSFGKAVREAEDTRNPLNAFLNSAKTRFFGIS